MWKWRHNGKETSLPVLMERKRAGEEIVACAVNKSKDRVDTCSLTFESSFAHLSFIFYSNCSQLIIQYITICDYLRLPYSLSGVFSYQPSTLLIHVRYPQTNISMESL